jgi:hypothetical protein
VGESLKTPSVRDNMFKRYGGSMLLSLHASQSFLVPNQEVKKNEVLENEAKPHCRSSGWLIENFQKAGT